MSKVTINVSPSVDHLLTDAHRRQVAEEMLRRVEDRPDWRVGKSLELGLTLSGVDMFAALDYRLDGLFLLIGLPSEMKFDRNADARDGQNRMT